MRPDLLDWVVLWSLVGILAFKWLLYGAQCAWARKRHDAYPPVPPTLVTRRRRERGES